MNTINIVPAGDRALSVQLEQVIEGNVNDKVHGLMTAVQAAGMEGIEELIPTYCSLLVLYDPLKITYDRLRARLTELYENASAAEKKPSRLLHVPCCYGAHFGPDLAGLEALTGLSRRQIIELHSSTDYRVYMLGFLPGFVYLGGMDPRLEAPRLKTPRLKIPRGSVGIGGAQTGVYPMISPGGWQLIGATPLEFFDARCSEPVLCKAGDFIRFEPIDVCEYYDIRQSMQRGTYQLRITEVDHGN